MNELINRGNVEALADILALAAPATRWPNVAAAARTLDELSLRARTDQVSNALLADVRNVPGADYSTAAGVFRSAVGNPGFTGWTLWPVSEAAVTLALESGAAADFADYLALLAELTPRLTGEFAIRRLLARDPDTALEVVLQWTSHPDEHVRRLAPEGRVVRHGLRTLIKKGHPGALALQGFAPASVAVTALRLDRQVVAMPEELGFEFEISNTGSTVARLAVDYAVHYRKANGTQSVKVFI